MYHTGSDSMVIQDSDADPHEFNALNRVPMTERSEQPFEKLLKKNSYQSTKNENHRYNLPRLTSQVYGSNSSKQIETTAKHKQKDSMADIVTDQNPFTSPVNNIVISPVVKCDDFKPLDSNLRRSHTSSKAASPDKKREAETFATPEIAKITKASGTAAIAVNSTSKIGTKSKS